MCGSFIRFSMPVYPGAQWVLSLPKRLRWYLYRDPVLSTLVLKIFLDEVERALHRGAPEAPAEARFGVIAFIHRFGNRTT